ncbi:hypothetical protein DFQ01_13073 [Paenibacillus cellulosilyticus]|uniref:Uncharacterized protein n=1 Tax=Paenibacillus cellulosilyticus TaxID=375489 RepID=A0A2V2YM01_9BACL|nr:hypothetical protein DFQ01_13073 [Paenibacillus cellulosilyticus]
MHFVWSTAVIQVISTVILVLLGYVIYRIGKPRKKKASR